MRLITWNCCGRFREKAHCIAELDPKADIGAIQEVEPIESISIFPGEAPTFWHRTSPRPLKKSIGMISYTDIKLSPIDMMRGIRRYEARHKGELFQVMAVWTSKATLPKKDYRQLHDALIQPDISDWIRKRPTIILGDFNQSAKYTDDGWRTLKTLTDAHDLVSAYHEFFFPEEPFGKETSPTHYHHFKQEKAFHLDYCLLPKDWIPRIERVTVGAFSVWCQTKISDHVPLIVDLRFP